MPLVLPDAEQVAKAWAKTVPDLVALVDGRVSSRLPSDLGQPGGSEFPWLRVFRVPGTAPDTTGAFDYALMQWDAFAEGPGDDRGAPNYKSASQVARTLEAHLQELGNDLAPVTLTVDGEAVTIRGAEVVVGNHRLPEPQTGWARIRVDALFTIT